MKYLLFSVLWTQFSAKQPEPVNWFKLQVLPTFRESNSCMTTHGITKIGRPTPVNIKTHILMKRYRIPHV